jgi:hypothetical protein
MSRFPAVGAWDPALLAGTVSAHAETIIVTIRNGGVLPTEITPKSATPRWVNKDAFAHLATVKGGWEVMPRSGNPKHRRRYGGTVDYFPFHPNMRGASR